jgi:hypothetical protein
MLERPLRLPSSLRVGAPRGALARLIFPPIELRSSTWRARSIRGLQPFFHMDRDRDDGEVTQITRLIILLPLTDARICSWLEQNTTPMSEIKL